MRRPLLTLALLLLPSTALAGYKLLINDDFESGDHAAFQGGFVDGECWGVVYVPDSGDYPFDMVHLDALVGGTSAKAMFDIEFYSMSSTNMNNATRIDSSAVAMTGSSSSFNRIDLQSVDLEVTLPTVESGNIAIGLCLNSFSGYPAIARDVGGMDHANRNYIYLPGHGAWYQSNLFGLTGDWIQRLCIETDNFSGDECDSDTDADSDTDTDADSDADADADSDADTDTYWEDTTVPAELELYSITPDEMNLGEPIDVMLLGMGFDDGMDARIGGISITALSVVTGEQAEGRTPSSLPEGVHDVEVVLDDGDNAYLPSAFEVIGEVEPEEGCLGCSAGGTRGSLAWLGLGALGLALVVTRRRDS